MKVCCVFRLQESFSHSEFFCFNLTFGSSIRLHVVDAGEIEAAEAYNDEKAC